MITNFLTLDPIGFVKALASDAVLERADLLRLKAIIEQPAYAELSMDQLLVRLTETPNIPNPVEQPKHPKAVIDQKSFRGMLTIIISRAEIDGTPEQSEVWKKFEKTLESAAQQADGVSTSATHFAGMVSALIGSGLITEEEFERLAYDLDPHWQPTVQGTSIVKTLFPDEEHPFLTPRDIEMAKKV